MSRTVPEHPLIAVIGATGTGKSQLAVSLARRFNGEIINGDALQMYEGLPIITNKLPVGERRGVQHHLLGCIKLEEEPWTVRQFVDQASKIVEDIRSRNKVPILVGGTHYYTQSLLFRDAILGEENRGMTEGEEEQDWPILNAATGDMLAELRKLDPSIAQRWHPNDRRKIRRSLEVCLTTGQKASDIYDHQQELWGGNGTRDSESSLDQSGGCSLAASESPLRYNTLIFWTHAAQETLNTRLEKRVDEMVSSGLIEEAKYMYRFLQSQEQRDLDLDPNRGIWIAIGLKEFMPYFADGADSEALRLNAIERTKISTRKYAKRQVRWIRLKLQRTLTAAGSSHALFLLDGTDIQNWGHHVEAKALEVAATFLSGGVLPRPASLCDAAMNKLITSEGETPFARHCEICNKTLMSEKEWHAHLNGKGHKSAVRPKINWRDLYPRENCT